MKHITFMGLHALFPAFLALIVMMASVHAGVEASLQKFAEEQAIVAGEVEKLLSGDGQVMIYSLDPENRRAPKDGDESFFHGFMILGKAEVKSSSERKLLAAALAEDIRENSGIVAGCFNARHGLRITRESSMIDIVLCFECLSARSYNFNSGKGFLVSGSSAPEFNAFLDVHGIPRSEGKP